MFSQGISTAEKCIDFVHLGHWHVQLKYTITNWYFRQQFFLNMSQFLLPKNMTHYLPCLYFFKIWMFTCLMTSSGKWFQDLIAFMDNQKGDIYFCKFLTMKFYMFLSSVQRCWRKTPFESSFEDLNVWWKNIENSGSLNSLLDQEKWPYPYNLV